MFVHWLIRISVATSNMVVNTGLQVSKTSSRQDAVVLLVSLTRKKIKYMLYLEPRKKGGDYKATSPSQAY